MALTGEQLTQLLAQLRTPNEKSFAELTARFDGARNVQKVEDFVSRATIFKEINNISDANAIKGLPLLLDDAAATWWTGVKHEANTWVKACQLIKNAFSPPKPAWRVYTEIFANTQLENEAIDTFITRKRHLFSQLSDVHTEPVQINIIYGQLNLYIREKVARNNVTTFTELLQLGRIAEQNRLEQQTGTTVSDVKQERNKKVKSTKRCDYCHYMGHTADVCRKKQSVVAMNNAQKALPLAKEKSQVSCYGCNAPGVFRSNCSTCQQKEKPSSPNAIEFYSMNCKLGRDIPTVQVKILGHTGYAHIDTGARTSIAGSSLYKHLCNHGCIFQKNSANITLADGSTSMQQVFTTSVKIQLGDREIIVKFTALPNATDNRTLLGIDFLESSGIVLNLAQRTWNYVEFPLMAYPYGTAKSYPNAITDYVQMIPKRASQKTVASNTSPKTEKSSKATNTSPKLKSILGSTSRKRKNESTLGIERIVAPAVADDNSKFKKPFPPPPLQQADVPQQIETQSIFIKFSLQNSPEPTSQTSNVSTPEMMDALRENAKLPVPVSPIADTPPAVAALNENEISYYEDTPTINIFSIEIRSDEAEELQDNEKSELNQLLKSFENIFMENGPPARYAEHRINIGKHLPVASAPYRLSPVKRNVLKNELEKMMKNDIIEESDSPFAAPVVLIPKKDGSVRVCIDYRQLNSITTPDRYPLPRIDDLLQEAKSSAFMSTMDLRSGYWQINVHETDREKTAFVTPFGMYQFTRMPFGLRNAPATFQRLMDRLKNSIPDVPILAYLDDLIILSPTFNDHMSHLAKTFKQLEKFKLRAHRQKCRFVCSEVKYLGHIITKHGLNVDPAKVEAITSLPAPANIKKLLSFIQTCSWYRRFIPGFADVVQSLTKLTKKNAKWIWESEQTHAFDTLKTLLTSAPVLQQANEHEPFIIRTDASGYAIGAVLSQGEKDKEHPIEYASRLLTAAEKNYSTIEREALAVVWAVNKFRGYIEGAEVTIASDHQPLKWLMTIKSPTGRLARWALQLQPYNLNIVYIPGKTNIIADTLSRPECIHEPINECTICTVHIDLPRKNEAEIRNEQLKDDSLKNIIDAFEATSDNEEYRRWTNRGYFLNNGVLYRYQDETDNDEAQLVIPEEERVNILKAYHDDPTAGHYGITRTIARISGRYYWPGMRRQITEHVQKCIECQRYKATNKKPAGLLQSGAHTQRFEVISIDLFGPLPTSKDGYKHILIVEDVATRWIELFALKDATAENCATTLIDEVFFRYGIPRRMISDNGTQFVSAVMQKVTYCLDIRHVLTPVYHPQTNPVERKNRDLKPQLAICVKQEHNTWPENLAAIRFAMNTVQNQSTGFSSAYLNFGRELRTTDDITHDLREIVSSENFVAEITPKLSKMADTLKQAREVTEATQTRNQAYTDGKRREDPRYDPGDHVWVTSHVQSNAAKQFTSKLAPKRDGPYIVLQRHGPASYELASLSNPTVLIGTHHTSALTPVKIDDPATILPVNPIRRRGRPRKH